MRAFNPTIIGLGCLLVLGIMAGTGCGAGGDQEGGGQASPVIRTIEVKETSFELKPAEITLDEPGTYVFEAVNDSDGDIHALEVEGEGIEEETVELKAGQSARLKVDLKAGTYELYCPVDGHQGKGMEGTLTVKEGSGGSGGY